jgi:hypothetical protein
MNLVPFRPNDARRDIREGRLNKINIKYTGDCLTYALHLTHERREKS